MRWRSGKTAILLLLGLHLAGCTKELPFTGQDDPPKMVVSCFLDAGSPIDIVVSRSFGLLSDTSGHRLTGATVDVYLNEMLLTTLEHAGSGHYHSDVPVGDSGLYTIRVSHPDYPDVSGEDRIPANPDLVHTDSIELENGFPTLRLTLNDPPGPDYYAIKFTGYNKALIRDSTTFQIIDSIPQSIVLNAVSLEKIFDTDRELIDSRLPFATFTDRFFENGNIQLSFRLMPVDLAANLFQTRVDSVAVEVRHISASYYQFIRSYDKAKPIYGGPFGSYDPIYGNIKGGYGMVAGSNSITFTLPIQW